jgi:Na+/H+-dicarboxylate symporter
MIALGVVAGLDKIPYLKALGLLIGGIFINCFKFVSIPIIFLSLVVTFVNYQANGMMQQLWKNTLKYTLSTTLGAATLSCFLYSIIRPQSLFITPDKSLNLNPQMPQSYTDYLKHLVPSNVLQPFLENQVLTILILAVLFGMALRQMPNQDVRRTLADVFRGLHGVFIVFTRWLLRWMPIAVFGFMTMSVESIAHKHSLLGLGEYLLVIVLANLIQGFIVLPIWLKSNGFAPFVMMRTLMPALSVAFFSKSSVGTLPLTMDTVEQRLNISPEISRFVLPLCTSVNMNGCAAFIFTTVVFMMQNAHMALSIPTYLLWVLIATLAAIGNAGVPMGCYFLSMSLLVSLNVPIALMGLILPFYTLIDMLETALNVWSDCCVLRVVEKKLSTNPALSTISEN